MEGGLTLATNDERRIEVLNRVLSGLLTVKDAGPLLGVGERQARRLLQAYQRDGPRAVVHGNRGRRPAHAVTVEVRQMVAALATGRYAGVNHSHLAELLAERENIELPRSTLSRILREEGGLSSPRPQRRRSKHRSRRDRFPQEGMLLQIDASHHDWLQGRGPRLALLGAIDDATSKIVSLRFEMTEDARGYLLLLRDICRKTGVPQALYSDKHGVFWATRKETLQEQLAGRSSTTQFGRAMAELGIQIIAAHSPQAKGRIERLWGTLQDRLVSELRLAGVCTADEANAFLPGFIQHHNRSFAVVAEQPGSAYRPRLKAAALDQVLCFKNERVVSKDNLVSLQGVVLQLLPGPNRRGYSKATVAIHESLDHRFSIHFQGRQLPSRVVPLRKLLTPKPAAKRPAALAEPPSETPRQPLPWTPPADHPWRQGPAVTKSLST
jgi:transposase